MSSFGDRRQGWQPGRRGVLGGIGAAVLSGLGEMPALAAAARPVVETRSGKVRGTCEEGVQVFRGLPYAASTGGANRFAAPQPRAPWAGIREAAKPGFSPPQVDVSPFGLASAIEKMDEDCLFLNVFTPAASRQKKLPVMVWLHGGGWWVGAGSSLGSQGHMLARLGDVVVVTINHRLNLFGHLRLEDAGELFADSGNTGVLDMVAALRWVRGNIAAFGGDPGNVTIFGQSGGGSKVVSLMAAPAANGLFHKAIAQSCSGSLRLAGPDEAARMAQALSAQTGVPLSDGKEWQALPMETLVTAHAKVNRPFRPVLDGRTFKRHPLDPDAPPTAAGMPFMTGNTATETWHALRGNPKNFALEIGDVENRLDRFLHTDRAGTRRILDLCRGLNPTASPSDLLAMVTTEQMYVRNTTRGALLQSRNAAPVYGYIFGWETPVDGGRWHSPHGLELPFIFGPKTWEFLTGTGPDIAPLTRMMIATWAAFAHTGNPNNRFLPAWPRFDGARAAKMVLGLPGKVVDHHGQALREALSGSPYFEYTEGGNFVRP